MFFKVNDLKIYNIFYLVDQTI